MGLKTETAWEAFKDALAAAAAGGELPAATRNDDILTGFESVGPLGWRLHLLDGDVEVRNTYFGEGDRYELAALVEVTLAVEGEVREGRDGRLAEALEALTHVLFPTPGGLEVAGAFDGLELVGGVKRKHIPSKDNAPPIGAWECTVALLLHAPTPFG